MRTHEKYEIEKHEETSVRFPGDGILFISVHIGGGTSNQEEQIEGFILAEIERRFGGSLQEIQKKLGEALKTTEKKKRNIHVPGVEETVLQIHYSGITFVLLKENELQREFLLEAELTGKEFNLSWGVRLRSWTTAAER